MRTLAPQPPKSRSHTLARRGLRAAMRGLRAILAASFALPLLFAIVIAAQTAKTSTQAPARPATPPAMRSHTHRAMHSRTRRKHAAAKPAAQEAKPAAPPAPPAPKIPDWPANKKPTDASVVWDSRGLFIQASNSSLDQILGEVALKTGAKVEGMGADERIFGAYGPGPAREVLNKLLEGSGYNILMVGDLGGGAPRRIVLSGRPTGSAQPSGASTPANSESNQDEQQISNQVPQPYALPGIGVPGNAPLPPVPVRTPQQTPQYRQQMIQTQQQQQPNNQ
ncbi:MAG: hypothetical protein ACP5E2_06690 [Terracidiphilus sp.]